MVTYEAWPCPPANGTWKGEARWRDRYVESGERAGAEVSEENTSANYLIWDPGQLLSFRCINRWNYTYLTWFQWALNQIIYRSNRKCQGEKPVSSPGPEPLWLAAPSSGHSLSGGRKVLPNSLPWPFPGTISAGQSCLVHPLKDPGSAAPCSIPVAHRPSTKGEVVGHSPHMPTSHFTFLCLPCPCLDTDSQTLPPQPVHSPLPMQRQRHSLLGANPGPTFPWAVPGQNLL